MMKCASCTFENDSNSTICAVCERPLEDGFMSCPKCTFHCPIGDTTCAMCNSRLDEDLISDSEHNYNNQVYPVVKKPKLDSTAPISVSHYSISIQNTSPCLGIIEKLRTALSKQPKTVFYVCSPCPHVSQIGAEGAKWSCGYRNIQMLCGMLACMPEYRERLFDGTGVIPDVRGLQSWIERSWADGFDAVGCAELGGKLVNTKKWIGATECAVLLRYFGVRACIVDFNSANRANVAAGKELVYPWVQKYFQGECFDGSSFGNPEQRIVPPLYFQHQGHSRTIVGIVTSLLYVINVPGYEIKNSKSSLLLFDPGTSGDVISRILSSGASGWQRYVKRSLEKLKNPQFQIVYIKPGIMTAIERNMSKVLTSHSINI